MIKIRDISKDIVKEMKKVASQSSISVDELDKYTDSIYSDNSETTFYRIVSCHVPKVDEATASLKESALDSPMYFFISKGVIDDDGRRVAKLGALKDDLDSNVVKAISDQIQLGSLFLHCVYDEDIKRDLFNTNEISKLLEKSIIIKEDRRVIIATGLNAYFKGDYITSMHLMIPQFEHAIRTLIEMNGGNVLVPKDEIYNLKTFNHLLNDKIVYNVFGNDMVTYFRTLFTDNRGRNLRNKLAHGIMNLSEFEKQNADRVLHALLCLGFVRSI